MIRDLVALFGAGVASFLAPCIVPLVPAYLGVIAGGARPTDSETRSRGGDGPTGEDRAPPAPPPRSVGATLVFIAGFATVFAGLGAAAGLLGSSLGDAEAIIQRVGGAVVVVMGLALLGVIRGPLARERRLVSSVPAVLGPLRPFVMGIAFGAAWSPCVGPLLGAALTVAAASDGALRGTVLLVAYALGIGVPFLLASLGLASSPRATERIRRIAPVVERVGGGLLVVLGLLLLTGTYGHLTSYLARFTPAISGV